MNGVIKTSHFWNEGDHATLSYIEFRCRQWCLSGVVCALVLGQIHVMILIPSTAQLGVLLSANIVLYCRFLMW